MAVQSDTSRISYAGNNSTTTSYAVPFVFQENSHLKAIARAAAGVESVVTLTNHTGAGSANGGTVRTAAAVPATSTLVIFREVPTTQTTTYAEGGDFPAASHERALDKLTQITQQNARGVGRSVKIPETETTNTLLPSAQSRASRAMGFAPNGDVSVSSSTLAQIDGAVAAINTMASAPSGNSAGIAHIASGTGALATTVQAKLRESVSVKDFGAIGNGIADDTAAIQAAHNTSKPIYYPAGTYRVTSTITISSGQFVMLGDSSATILVGTDNLAPVFSVSNCSKTQVSGIRFDGNSFGKGFLDLSQCPKALVTQCEFFDFKTDAVTSGNYHAVLLRRSPRSRVSHNVFSNIGALFGGSGVTIPQYRAVSQEAGCNGTSIDSNVFDGVFMAFVVGEFPKWTSGDAYVVNSRVNYYNGTAFDQYRCISNHTASSANEPPNASFWVLEFSSVDPTAACSFNNNYCRNVRDNSVYCLSHVGSITISGNSFANANDESVVLLGKNSVVSGNSFYNTNNKAISLELGSGDMDSVAISGNAFTQDDSDYSVGTFIVYRNPTATGVVKALSITGNTFKSPFSVAPASYVALRHCDNLTISGNVFDVAAVANERIVRTFNTVTRGVIANNVFQSSDATALPFGNDSTGSKILIANNLYNGRMLANTAQEIPMFGVVNDTGSNIYINEPARRMLIGNGPPTTGEWTRGDIIWRSAQASGSVSGWTCTASGSPGTWHTLATVGRETTSDGWTPAFTGVTNIAATTAWFSLFSRIGQTVTISGQVTIDPTATGTVSLRMSLPVASDFTASRQAAGVVMSKDATIMGAFEADITNNEILITAQSSTTAATVVQFTGSYTIA